MTGLIVAQQIQATLERSYRIDRVADVGPFIRPASSGREKLILREARDGAVEMRLELPTLSNDLDSVCQIIEGVSHFVYVAARVAENRTTTELELEIQAEVDKYVVLSGDIESLDISRSSELREQLYERIAFLHAPHSEAGERYRVANQTARRFVHKLERVHLTERRFSDLRRDLNQFYHSGQEEKLRFAA